LYDHRRVIEVSNKKRRNWDFFIPKLAKIDLGVIVGAIGLVGGVNAR
jgi:hypothetical protein